MVPRISTALFVAVVAAGCFQQSWAFSLQIPIANKNNAIRRPICYAHYSSTSSLHMSSIPEDDDDLISSFYNIVDQFKLPPAPEDHIALSGDIVALFVYTYLDHTMNELYADTAAKIDVAELITYDPNTSTGVQLPVWFDSTQLQTFGENWFAVGAPSDMYAPVIAGKSAFVLCYHLNTCDQYEVSVIWLLC